MVIRKKKKKKRISHQTNDKQPFNQVWLLKITHWLTDCRCNFFSLLKWYYLGVEKSSLHKEQIELDDCHELERNGSPSPEPRDFPVEDVSEPDGPVNLFKPEGDSLSGKMYWYIMWLGNLIFFLTIPDVRRKGWRWTYPIAFFICILWIGSLSYLVAWFITVIGTKTVLFFPFRFPGQLIE